MDPNFVNLTEYESGMVIYVDRLAIRSCRRLAAEVHEPLFDGDSAQELGERTRVDTFTDMFLVQETPEVVLGSQPVQVSGWWGDDYLRADAAGNYTLALRISPEDLKSLMNQARGAKRDIIHYIRSRLYLSPAGVSPETPSVES